MSSSNAPGPPLLSLVLTALPSPNVDDGARSRLWMCPLDMHDARLRSGATVALMRDSTHAAAATATTATASANGQGLCRQTLWPLSPSSSSSSSSSPAPSPGCSVVLADAWPGPKVPRGRASPSRALAASLGLLRVSAAEGGRRNRGGRSSSSSPPAPSPLPTTDGVAVSLLAPPPPPPDANGEGDEEAAELVLRPLEEGGEEEATERDRTTILGPRQRAALSALAARRASGRRFLRGNVIVIPLLGRDAPFEVVKVVVSGSNVSRSLSGWEEAKVGARTRVRVFGGGENGGNDDDDENSDSEGKEDEDDAEARASSSSASAALRYDDEGDPLFAAAAFAAARAAEKAIGGGHSGPAASAAAAAAAAGAHALHGALSRARAAAAKNGDDYSSKSSDGFAPLGGVEALSKRLRDLVTLPLSNPGVFALYGLRAPAGAVLHGPPGTGKTALATAAAADAALALMARAEKKEKDKNKKRNGKSEENTLVSLFVVGGAEVVRSAAGASEEGLRGVFAAARAAPGPSVVFLDEVDALAPARGKGGGGGGGGGGGSGATAPVKAAAASGASARLSAALAAELDAISNSASSSSSTRIVVLAATNRLDAVDHGLRRPGRLDAEVEVPPPGAGGRAAILRSYLCPSASSASSSSPSPPPAAGVLRRHSLTEKDVSCLAAAAHGFVGADLALLVREAASFALRRAVKNSSEKNRSGRGKPNGGGGGAEAEAEAEEGIDLGSPDLVVSRDDFDAARRVVRPSAMRSVMLRLPRARWEDVGGQKVAKSRLQEALATRCSSSSSSSSSSSPTVSKNPALLGVAPPAGILLYGPPGCSKTLLARAAARESGRNLFAVKAGELLSCYVGDSERAVASLFKAAKAASPSLVFFDEVDGLATRREEEGADGSMVSTATNEASARVVAQLLLELDAVAALADKSSSSSSDADSLESGVAPVVVIAATNRPDRVDPALLRPGRLERRIHVGPPVDAKEREEVLRAAARRCPLAGDVELGSVAAATEGFTGADLAALVRSATTLAAEEGEEGAESVCARHFAEALRTARPSRRFGGGGSGVGDGGKGNRGDRPGEAERVFASCSRPGLG